MPRELTVVLPESIDGDDADRLASELMSTVERVTGLDCSIAVGADLTDGDRLVLIEAVDGLLRLYGCSPVQVSPRTVQTFREVRDKLRVLAA